MKAMLFIALAAAIVGVLISTVILFVVTVRKSFKMD